MAKTDWSETGSGSGTTPRCSIVESWFGQDYGFEVFIKDSVKKKDKEARLWDKIPYKIKQELSSLPNIHLVSVSYLIIK